MWSNFFLKTLLMSLSLLLQLCLVYLLCLTWMVCEMGCKWPYSCCFVWCCFKDLFKIACSILLWFPSGFFSKCFITHQVLHSYSSTDTTTARKKSRFIFIRKIRFPYDWQPDSSRPCLLYTYFDITFSSWDIAAMVCELIYWGLPLKIKMAPSCLKHMNCVHAETNASYCMLETMQQGFVLGRCICEKCYIISVGFICHSFLSFLM